MQPDRHTELSYTIELSENKQYILITVKGLVTRKGAMEYTIESHELGHEVGIRKFLVDLIDARNNESVGNNYDLAYKDLPENPVIDRRARVAFLVDKDDYTHDFIETVSINAGHNVRMFRDKIEALKYLGVE